jgi:hypothetical protein
MDIGSAALAGWQAPRRSAPGGQPRRSYPAIELVPSLRLVARLALRQAVGSARSVLALRGLGLAVPNRAGQGPCCLCPGPCANAAGGGIKTSTGQGAIQPGIRLPLAARCRGKGVRVHGLVEC